MSAARRIAVTTALFFGVAVFLLFGTAKEALAAGNVSGWAWSGNTGWISMNCSTDPVGCAGAGGDYGVTIEDDGRLTGWAWSSQAGWICFGETCIGVSGVPAAGTPAAPAAAADHYCPGFIPCARYDAGDGQLHGWAYVISQTDGTDYRGWISLNCTDVGTNTALPHSCPSSDYAVTFDETATQPAGEFYGYAWNGNGDTTGNGWILFGCGTPHASCGAPGSWGTISTWVDTGWDGVVAIEGAYTPPPSSGTYISDIPLAFTVFSAPPNSTLHCVFRMSNGGYRHVNVPITERRVQVPVFSATYTVQTSDELVDGAGNPVVWSLSSEPPDPPYGCEVIGSPPEQKAVANRVAVHPADWTFSGPAGAAGLDAVRAKYCLDGNTDTDPARAYFRHLDPDGNVVQCDTEGDLAFTLLKARGIPVEVRCYDNVDDDANFQRDCAGGAPVMQPDRNCRGITYLCIPHPPASAPQPPRP